MIVTGLKGFVKEKISGKKPAKISGKNLQKSQERNRKSQEKAGHLRKKQKIKTGLPDTENFCKSYILVTIQFALQELRFFNLPV